MNQLPLGGNMSLKEDQISIHHLVDVPDATKFLETWFIEEWMPWYGPDGPGDAAADIAACSARDTLPICLVAVDQNQTVMGTIALKTQSVGSELGVGPWLAALLVGQDYRGKGVATALVGAIEKEAKKLQFDAIYTSTDSAAGIMRQRRWEVFGQAGSLRGEVIVFRCDLNQDKSQT